MLLKAFLCLVAIIIAGQISAYGSGPIIYIFDAPFPIVDSNLSNFYDISSAIGGNVGGQKSIIVEQDDITSEVPGIAVADILIQNVVNDTKNQTLNTSVRKNN